LLIFEFYQLVHKSAEKGEVIEVINIFIRIHNSIRENINFFYNERMKLIS